MTGRRVSFWLAVAGVSLLTPYAVESAATRWPNSPIAAFAAFLHKG